MTELINGFNYFIEMLHELRLEFESLPNGSLIKQRNASYSHKISGKSFCITNNHVMIRKLARKRFIKTLISRIEYNLGLMKNSLTSPSEKIPSLPIKKFKSLHPRDIIKSLPKSYQGLCETYFYHPFATQWIAQNPTPNDYMLELKVHKSKKGVFFRSKSEQSFGNLLEDNKLPYKSDVELTLGGKTKCPDFITINPFLGKLSIWEFYGLADQSGYDEKMNEKMVWYRENGCNVINLFESDMRDTQYLQELIDEKIWGTKESE